MESEVVQAAELLEQWRERSPIEVTDALKLLGKNVAFQTGLVRICVCVFVPVPVPVLVLVFVGGWMEEMFIVLYYMYD